MKKHTFGSPVVGRPWTTKPLMAPGARLVIAAAGDFHRGWLLSSGQEKEKKKNPGCVVTNAGEEMKCSGQINKYRK